jgi:hypothetical protein
MLTTSPPMPLQSMMVGAHLTLAKSTVIRSGREAHGRAAGHHALQAHGARGTSSLEACSERAYALSTARCDPSEWSEWYRSQQPPSLGVARFRQAFWPVSALARSAVAVGGLAVATVGYVAGRVRRPGPQLVATVTPAAVTQELS